MIIGLGMGILSMAFLAAILICHRKRKRKNHAEHPMLPSHAHFHTCESIGERFATSSSMDSVRFSFGIGCWIAFSKIILFNKQYMTNSTLVYPVKMEYGGNLWLKVSFIICTYIAKNKY